ncbi:MAG TPA: hypothetical protein ENF47_02610 [Thermoprotei archaeon]|nr:hypothetical protein [Thermoprotei archaeon]
MSKVKILSYILTIILLLEDRLNKMSLSPFNLEIVYKIIGTILVPVAVEVIAALIIYFISI